MNHPQAAIDAARRVFSIEANAISAAFKAFDDTAFLQAVELLSTAPRIAAGGCGHSGIACRHFART